MIQAIKKIPKWKKLRIAHEVNVRLFLQAYMSLNAHQVMLNCLGRVVRAVFLSDFNAEFAQPLTHAPLLANRTPSGTLSMGNKEFCSLFQSSNNFMHF